MGQHRLDLLRDGGENPGNFYVELTVESMIGYYPQPAYDNSSLLVQNALREMTHSESGHSRALQDLRRHHVWVNESLVSRRESQERQQMAVVQQTNPQVDVMHHGDRGDSRYERRATHGGLADSCHGDRAHSQR